ncbi:hypothetical protein [Crocosphaera sp.]|uniref:hypothetical protein n=1 Tax=Crocosphaera sp. TaxID=2729996 RepID=UPI0026249367|nr:hypothetical protein [Crocosphaera sp.]MDJ0578600.1 hypothetical protein [Crocosphaera sp.]
MRIKSWESPRKMNRRNDKGRLASARLRQLKKRNKQLKQDLKNSDSNNCGN